MNTKLTYIYVNLEKLYLKYCHGGLMYDEGEYMRYKRIGLFVGMWVMVDEIHACLIAINYMLKF